MIESPSSLTHQASFDTPSWLRLSEGLSYFLIRRRIILSSALFAAMVVANITLGVKPHDPFDVHDPLSMTGVTLVVAGLALRSWAVGILKKDAELATQGPYRLIRNPLYVGSFLMMFGFCALVGNAFNLLVLLGPIVAIYSVKVRQEERSWLRCLPRIGRRTSVRRRGSSRGWAAPTWRAIGGCRNGCTPASSRRSERRSWRWWRLLFGTRRSRVAPALGPR